MSLLDDMRVQVRVAGNDMDGEIRQLIDAATGEMARLGIDPLLLDEGNMDPLVKQAVACYVKANFGFDNPDAARLGESFRRITCDLLNSPANLDACACHGHHAPGVPGIPREWWR